MSRSTAVTVLCSRHRRRGMAVLGLCLDVCLGASGLERIEAQGVAPARPVAADAIARVDTSTLRPGRQDFTRYTTPGACLQAAIGVWSGLERTVVPDTAAYASAGDTLEPAVQATARTCGARFTPANVPVVELQNLIELALAAGDEARARAAADRYVAAQPDEAARGWALYAVYGLYMRAHPMRVGAADTVLLRLDALGATAAVPRAFAHGEARHHARRMFDVPRLRREALLALKLEQALTAADRDFIGMDVSADGSVAVELLETELYEAPQGAMTRVVARLREAGFKRAGNVAGFFQAMLGPMLVAMESSDTVPRLTVKYWRPPASRPGEHTWPVAGKVSLYTIGGAFGSNYLVGMYRRLLAKYGDAVVLTTTERTRGFFRDSPPLTPEQEADRIAHYYHDVLQLPVTLAIDESPVRVLPDGRRNYGAAPFEDAMPYRSGFIMADRAGKVVLMFPSMTNEAELDAFIAKALGR